MDATPEIQSQLPLTEATYFILLSLAPGPRHGYAIIKDVRALSRGRVSLSTGTLYTALKRLLDSGWIQPANDGSLVSTGRQRKGYNLTSVGRRILQAEVQRLEGLVSAAQYGTLNRLP